MCSNPTGTTYVPEGLQAGSVTVTRLNNSEPEPSEFRVRFRGLNFSGGILRTETPPRHVGVKISARSSVRAYTVFCALRHFQ